MTMQPCSLSSVYNNYRQFGSSLSTVSKIGSSVPKKVEVEGEKEKLLLVQLGKGNRKKLRAFFVEAITQESDAVLTKLGDSPSKTEYQAAIYRLKKLQELRKCVENENYQYLQRV